MLTYIINTSDNKTFDSRMLFTLAGYSKVRWIHCALTDVSDVATKICEKQNIVGAEDFRVAIIVDLYSFDKIRNPYGRRGYREDVGVDLSLYIPYIEVFLLDNFVSHFEKSNLFARDVEIFYVQNEKCDHYDLFKNAKSQLMQVMHGIEPLLTDGEAEMQGEAVTEDAADASIEAADAAFNAEVAKILNDELSFNYNEEDGFDSNTPEQTTRYSAFELYCTPDISLTFRLTDYPYSAEPAMTFSEFRNAFRSRQTHVSGLRRHFYVVPYGGGRSRAALAMLSLSLFLVRMYEREEDVPGDGNMDMLHLDAVILRDVLETAWSKILIAKGILKKKSIEYYALDQSEQKKSAFDDKEEKSEEELQKEALSKERAAITREVEKQKPSVEKLYRTICKIADPNSPRFEEEKQKEFDEIMSEYLRQRDTLSEADVVDEFRERKMGGFLNTTEKCPSREEYNHFVDKKKRGISAIFEKVLKTKYIDVDYKEEKKQANDTYREYKKAKACMTRNIIGDIFFMILTLASVLLPYVLLQLTSFQSKTLSSIILFLYATAVFSAIFLGAMALRLIPIIRTLKRTRQKMRRCYVDCRAKQNYAFSALKQRYEKDLVQIERTKYDLRQIKYIYESNLEKERLLASHREMLGLLENCLGSILNNLDVEPSPDLLISIDDELNVLKPVASKENRIYQVFSVETIEKMLPSKGSDRE